MQLLGEGDEYEEAERESDMEPVDIRLKRHLGCSGDDSEGGDAPGSSQTQKKKKKKVV